MEMEFDVKIIKKDLYDYQLYHTYTSVPGLFGTIVGCLFLIAFFRTMTVLYLIVGIFLLLYLPWILNIRAGQQAASPLFQEPLHYHFTDEGVEVSQGEQQQQITWDIFTKAVSTRKSIILYTTKVNAFIFPRRDLGEKTNDFIEMVSTHMPPAKVKIRGAI